MIASYLDFDQDLGAFSLASKQLHPIISSALYRNDIQNYSRASGLFLAAKRGQVNTAMRFLQHGANVNL
jgi:hypothetical protein